MHVQSPTKEKVNNCCCCYVVAIDTEPSVKDTTHLWSQNALSQNGYGERERERDVWVCVWGSGGGCDGAGMCGVECGGLV